MNEFKDFKNIPKFVPEPSPQIQPHKKTWRPPVVNSKHIDWKPIDRVAARVVAPAQWYNQPPEEPPKFETMEEDPLTNIGGKRISGKTVVNKEGYRETLIDPESVSAAAVDHHDIKVKAGAKQTQDLIDKSRELITAIDYLATEIGGPWAQFETFVKAALTTTREQRIALGSETRMLMGALKEVRQFFLEDSYETEITRLHEFIDLCERLQALHQSGFIDVVTDTMLKLSDQRK